MLSTSHPLVERRPPSGGLSTAPEIAPAATHTHLEASSRQPEAESVLKTIKEPLDRSRSKPRRFTFSSLFHRFTFKMIISVWSDRVPYCWPHRGFYSSVLAVWVSKFLGSWWVVAEYPEIVQSRGSRPDTCVGHGNEVILRETLYDAVIKMDHTFLGPRGGILLPGKQLKDLVLTWSFVADNAIRSLMYDSECGDQGLVQLLFIRISHPTNLTSHDLRPQGECQTGMSDKARSLNVSTPLVLLSELPAISMLVISSLLSGLQHLFQWMVWIRMSTCYVMMRRYFVLTIVQSGAFMPRLCFASRVEHEIRVDKTSGKCLGENLSCMVHERKEDKKADSDLEMIDSMDTVPLVCSLLDEINSNRWCKKTQRREHR
ncbi:N-MYC downregulated-like 2 isoform 1 [Hibiscus syriacus]|uniref:N-MYC downregulated-like 2 isoform 1 n=1 Tax=Hibiscus syriacus TaxID=106335 RepID=A0A6A3BGY4_HIBSY|nr:N-MYC downregulated-like 2 isoform 1 [Hibiscus syriacus]